MTDITTLLDAYPALSAAERAQVDARLADLPEWAGALAEAHRLADLVDAATAPIDADALARHAVDRRMGLASDDDAIAEARARDPELDAEAERIEAHLRDLEAGAEDPLRRYERLTGLFFSEAPAVGGDSLAARPLLDRPPAPPPRTTRWRAPRWLAAAAVLLVAYGAAFAVSTATQPERARVAALTDIDAVPPSVLRGGDPADAQAEELTEALDAVHGARRSVLGLFPTYDAEALTAAAARLGTIADQAGPTSWIAQEARLAQGRVLLHLGRDAEAARVLGGLVEQGSYRGSVARRLLDALREGALPATP